MKKKVEFIYGLWFIEMKDKVVIQKLHRKFK